MTSAQHLKKTHSSVSLVPGGDTEVEDEPLTDDENSAPVRGGSSKVNGNVHSEAAAVQGGGPQIFSALKIPPEEAPHSPKVPLPRFGSSSQLPAGEASSPVPSDSTRPSASSSLQRRRPSGLRVDSALNGEASSPTPSDSAWSHQSPSPSPSSSLQRRRPSGLKVESALKLNINEDKSPHANGSNVKSSDTSDPKDPRDYKIQNGSRDAGDSSTPKSSRKYSSTPPATSALKIVVEIPQDASCSDNVRKEPENSTVKSKANGKHQSFQEPTSPTTPESPSSPKCKGRVNSGKIKSFSSSNHSFGSLGKRLLPRWNKRSLPKQLCAVVRHGERADTVFDDNPWSQSDDFKMHPHDPPLTKAGKKQAHEVGQVLKHKAPDGNSFHIVVTSPYIRCVRTAIGICHALGPEVPLLVDYEMGEVYGPCTMGENKPDPRYRRSWDFLVSYCKRHKVNLRHRPVGKWPEWPEELHDARVRFAKRYLKYLHRSLKTRRNFVLVTHADGVATALTVMPSAKDKYIMKVDFCGYFLGSRAIDPVDPRLPMVPDTPNSTANAYEALEDAADSEQPEGEGIGRGWSLKRDGIKVSKASGTQQRALSQLLGDSGSYTWDQIEQLLGELPPEVVSNDGVMAVRQRNGSAVRQKLAFSKFSLSTFLFGRGESTASVASSKYSQSRNRKF